MHGLNAITTPDIVLLRIEPVINFISMESKVPDGCASSQSMDAWEKRSGAGILAGLHYFAFVCLMLARRFKLLNGS
jgi:hypothetical protein